VGEPTRVEVDHRDDTLIATIHGDVDLSNVDVVGRTLNDALNHGTFRHIVDLTYTTFLDSVGIHLLFSLAESLRMRRQELRIAVPDESSIARVLRLTDVQTVIPMYPDVATALAAKSDELTF
jgi:anti-anti-sigma factor